MFKRLAVLAGMTAAAAPAAGMAGNADVLAALESTGFWSEEDHAQEEALKAQVAAEGVVALYGSRRVVQLDAESLAEGGIADGLLRVGPQVRARGLRLDDFATLRVEPDYAVRLNGKTYEVYGADDLADGRAIWPLATETFFRMLNENMSSFSKDRAYALFAGNDLQVIFISPALVPFFETMPVEQRPYTPTRNGPQYGFGEGVAP